jgi:signal transduction histidine kinase
VSVAVFTVLTVAVFVLTLTLRRRAPFVPFLLSALLSVLSPAINGALTVLGYAVGRYDGRWAARITAALTGMLVVARPWDGGPAGEQFSRWLGGAVLVLLPGAVGIYVRTRAQLLAALRERAERAEAEQELLARDAVLTERTRIAREMHDAVGHRVSLMVLQAGAIDMAADDPDRVRRLADQLQDAGRRSLEELRQLLGLLQEDPDEDAPLAPQPGLGDVEELVGDSREAGLEVTMTRCGTPRELDPTVGRTAYRVVQEALTNAGKHAPGGPVTVTLDLRAAELAVTVTNRAATRPPTALPSGGLGLIGLRERVRTVGGTLRAEPRLDGGFRVEAVLPG